MIAPLLLISCSTSEEEVTEDISVQNAGISLIELLSDNNSITAKRPQPTIWADCKKYTGIVVPATFKPESDPFDELYTMPGATFKDGIPLISDSKPGDQDYNGGRWHLNVLKAGVDPAKYANACYEEDLDPNDFDSTDTYFGCPLTRLKK